MDFLCFFFYSRIRDPALFYPQDSGSGMKNLGIRIRNTDDNNGNWFKVIIVIYRLEVLPVIKYLYYLIRWSRAYVSRKITKPNVISEPTQTSEEAGSIGLTGTWHFANKIGKLTHRQNDTKHMLHFANGGKLPISHRA
jgi:hypothetical protein